MFKFRDNKIVDKGQIIKDLQERQESAFRQLVENYQKMVVNTCVGFVHNLEDAEDISQEVFIEVYNSIHKFRSDSKLSTWIYRIAVNKSLNYIRDNKRNKWLQNIEQVFSGNKETPEKLVAEGSGQPGFDLENSQRAKMLHEAIEGLPENQKVAFTLNKYEELSYQMISNIMEVSVSSVESLIHRAKKNLQKKLYTCYKKRCI